LLFFACAKEKQPKETHHAYALFALCAKEFVSLAGLFTATSMLRFALWVFSARFTATEGRLGAP